MYFAAFRFLVSIKTCTITAFWRRFQCSRIKHNSRGLLISSLRFANHCSQIINNRFKVSRSDPALRLLIHYLPRWKMMRKISPRRTAATHPTQRIEYFSQIVFPLRCIFLHQGKIRGYKSPLFVGRITRVSSLVVLHP